MPSSCNDIEYVTHVCSKTVCRLCVTVISLCDVTDVHAV